MGWRHALSRWLPRRDARDKDLERELLAHLDAEADEQAQRGLNPHDSHYAARRSLGNLAQIHEDTRDTWGWTSLERIGQDLRYALRTMRRSPGFTAVAVVSLALGLGANTAIFTFVNAAIIRPLPYKNSNRIVVVEQRPVKSDRTTLVHPRSFLSWKDQAQSFDALAIAQPISVNTQGLDAPEQVPGLWTTPQLFQVFQVEPALGRVFTDTSGPDVVVLSHGYWRRRYGSDPNILGKAFALDRGAATIVGVMPAGFKIGTLDVDVYRPILVDRSRPDAIGSRSFLCFALLRAGMNLDAARAELAVIANQVGRDHPGEKDFSPVVSGLRDYLVRDSRLVLLVLSGVVAFVLLIACANIAGLLLSRGAGRRSELALRTSLGAGRSRLIQQLLTESVVLAGIGGLLGLFAGWWTSRMLVLLAQNAVAFGQTIDVHLDWRVLLFTFGLSLLAAVVFGLAPAWQASRVELQSSLQEHGRTGSSSGGQRRLRSALVVGEVALAVVLLVGASLLLRTFVSLLEVKLGFEPQQALTMRMLVMGDPGRRSALVENVLDRVEALPGVSAAGTIQFLPLSGWTNHGPFHFVGQPRPESGARSESDVSTVSRGYFAAMGIPILRGRPFGRQDRMDSSRVALVNESFVRRYSSDQDPIGRVILGDWANPKPTEIVGVVADVRHNGLTAEPRPTVFLAQVQVPGYFTHIVVRTAMDPAQMASAVRREVRQVDPAQPVAAVQTMEHHVSNARARPRLYATLLGAFASLALLLAAIGLYGLMAFAVTRRRHEIGIRLALGAEPGNVLRSVLADGAWLVLAGLGIGLISAVALSRLIANLLYGVTTSDVPTYVGVVALLAVVALIATYIPARRAARVDPMVALRYE